MPDNKYAIGAVVAFVLFAGFTLFVVLGGKPGDLMAWTEYLKPGLPPATDGN